MFYFVISIIIVCIYISYKSHKNNHKWYELILKNNIKKVQALVKNGADVNAKDNYGMTAFMWTVLKGNKEISELLLKNGANVNTEDNDS